MVKVSLFEFSSNLIIFDSDFLLFWGNRQVSSDADKFEPNNIHTGDETRTHRPPNILVLLNSVHTQVRMARHNLLTFLFILKTPWLSIPNYLAFNLPIPLLLILHNLVEPTDSYRGPTLTICCFVKSHLPKCSIWELSNPILFILLKNFLSFKIDLYTALKSNPKLFGEHHEKMKAIQKIREPVEKIPNRLKTASSEFKIEIWVSCESRHSQTKFMTWPISIWGPHIYWLFFSVP